MSKILRAISKICTMVCGIGIFISEVFRVFCKRCTILCGIRRAISNKIGTSCKPITAVYKMPAMMSNIVRALYEVPRKICKMLRLLNYCESLRAKRHMILPISNECSYKFQVKVPFFAHLLSGNVNISRKYELWCVWKNGCRNNSCWLRAMKNYSLNIFYKQL